jgi:hypothetical protein
VPWLRRLLSRSWAALLQDWALLGSQPPEVVAAYVPAFLPPPPLAFLPRVQDALDAAAPSALLSLAAFIASDSAAATVFPPRGRLCAASLCKPYGWPMPASFACSMSPYRGEYLADCKLF